MGTAATNDRYDDAMALFNGGDFQAARELALSGLADEPKDVNLLRLAGRSSAELDLSDVPPTSHPLGNRIDLQRIHESRCGIAESLRNASPQGLFFRRNRFR